MAIRLADLPAGRLGMALSPQSAAPKPPATLGSPSDRGPGMGLPPIPKTGSQRIGSAATRKRKATTAIG